MNDDHNIHVHVLKKMYHKKGFLFSIFCLLKANQIMTEIYFERQIEDASLCGQHALNNLLQGPYFTAFDLAEIGNDLDKKEELLMKKNEYEIISDNNNGNNKQKKYKNVSMEGLFSVEVLKCALESIGLKPLPLSHPECQQTRVYIYVIYCVYIYYIKYILCIIYGVCSYILKRKKVIYFFKCHIGWQ